MRALFGTDGIRGKAHAYPLDPATMYRLGAALVHRFRQSSTSISPLTQILIGRDTRESGPEIVGALAAGIRDEGGDPVVVGVIPTPGVAYLCRVTDAVAAISVSASHNPFEDNGVKIFGHDGMKLPDAVEEEIEEDLRAGGPGPRAKDMEVPADSALGPRSSALVERYQQFLIDSVAPKALDGMKVVLDTGHGAAFRIAPDVFRRAGADVIVMNDKPDGRNINENAGALHAEGLAHVVMREGADFGVAFDGDADRAIFADDAGRIRDGDEIIYLWARRLQRDGKLKGECVVTTVMSNYGFEKQLRKDGIGLCRAQVGDKYVLELMLERGAILGGEQSGHIIDLSVHTTGDGIHTALVFGEILSREGRPFSSLETFDPMPQVLVNEKVASKPPLESLPRFQDAYDTARKDLGGQGRILVRYSGTENKVRVMVEGPDAEVTGKIARWLASVLKEEIG